ncbi:hypothetical protein CHUAL_008402 [Chamberlinius hualienensis]
MSKRATTQSQSQSKTKTAIKSNEKQAAASTSLSSRKLVKQDEKSSKKKNDKKNPASHHKSTKNDPKRVENVKKSAEKVTKQSSVTKLEPKTESTENGDKYEEEYDKYSDDFEDYESDFEPEAEPEEISSVENDEQSFKHAVEAIPDDDAKEMAESAEFKMTKTEIKIKPQIIDDAPALLLPIFNVKQIIKSEQPVSSTGHLNFKMAKHQLTQQKATNTMKKRWKYLKEIISLDTVTMSFYAQPSIPYEIFMNLYGMGQSAQAFVQTGDDDVNEDCQTDSISMMDQWTQFPPHINCDTSSSKNPNAETDFKVTNWKNLSNFIRHSAKIISNLLEEEEIYYKNNSKTDSIDEMVFGQSKNILFKPPKYLINHSVVQVSSASHQPYKLLVIYEANQNKKMLSRSLLLQWDARWPSKPQKILCCHSNPTCCGLDAHSKIAFAGMCDGSVAVWDLEELDNAHAKLMIDKEELIVRIPSYSTAEVMKENGHQSRVVAVECVKEQSGVTQLVTIEEMAKIIIWIVMESQVSREDDLGMSPNSNIYLIKASTMDLQIDQGGMRVSAFLLQPQNENIALVAADNGSISMCSLILNKRRRLFKHHLNLPLEVTSLNFTSDNQQFLAAFNDATVQLFSILKEKPIKVWHLKEITINISYSQSTVFSLTSEGEIQLWKLNDENDKIISKKKSKQKPTHIDVIGDNRSQLIIGYDNAVIELNSLQKTL